MPCSQQAVVPVSSSLAIGARDETLDGKKKAMSQFNRFMAEYPEYQITEDTIIDVLSNFAGWLCIQKKSDGDYFAPQTMTQYLSGVKETILSKNKYWPVWFGHDNRNSWYGKLRRGSGTKAGKRLIDNGERLEEVSPPLSKQQVMAIIMSLLLTNTREGILLAIWVSLTRLCIGRAGELAIQSWDCMTWNDAEGGAVLEWHELKTTDKKEALLNNDFKHFQLDPKFMFAIYMISECSKNVTCITESGNFIFPSLAALSRPAQKLNVAIKKMIRPAAPKDGALYVWTLQQQQHQFDLGQSMTFLQIGEM